MFTNSIWGNFVNILSVDTIERSTHADITECKLIGLFDLFPERTSIFTTIYKDFFCSTFEYTALNSKMKRTSACQDGIGICGIVLFILFDKDTPRA